MVPARTREKQDEVDGSRTPTEEEMIPASPPRQVESPPIMFQEISATTASVQTDEDQQSDNWRTRAENRRRCPSFVSEDDGAHVLWYGSADGGNPKRTQRTYRRIP